MSTVFVRSTSETMRLNIVVPNGGQGDFLFNGNAGVITATNFAVVPGNTDWMFAQVTTLEGQIAVEAATRIENTSTPFHLGIINGGASSGTRFGYFSDYGALKYETSYEQLNPCLGDPLELDVNPIENGLYQWTGPNNFSASGLEVNVGIANTNTAGMYVVQGFTGECEIENDSLEVVVHQPLPPPVLSGDIETCEGLTISMGADSENVLWTGPDGFESQGQYVVIDNIAVGDAGVYTATLDDPYCPPGAESTLVVTVATDEDLSFVWEDEREFCQGEEVVIGLPSEVFGSPEINWVFYEEGVDEPVVLATGQDATVTSAGMLVVEAFSEPPCVVRSEGVIHITYADCDLVIPNVITPGDDNLNKRFKVTNLNQFPNSTIQIFNRWGQEVFSHDDFGSTSGWLPGQNLSEGAYYFVLHVMRTDQVIGVETENGMTMYDQPGAIDLHGSFMVFW
jgi:gliding motility-associated-like protein